MPPVFKRAQPGFQGLQVDTHESLHRVETA
jgi:hypothetical protein